MKKYLIRKYNVRLQKFENFFAISTSHLKANKKMYRRRRTEEKETERNRSILRQNWNCAIYFAS